jgi:PHD/YefM family antitoxin component YafN of YafNO toxin-antitoxin module
MNTLSAQELKRRGLAAVDEKIADGDLHVIRNNQPQYVVLSEERYRELIAEAQEGYLARVKTALEEVRAGKVQTFTSADDLLRALDSDESV